MIWSFFPNCSTFKGGLYPMPGSLPLWRLMRVEHTTDVRITGVQWDLISGYWEWEALTPLASGKAWPTNFNDVIKDPESLYIFLLLSVFLLFPGSSWWSARGNMFISCSKCGAWGGQSHPIHRTWEYRWKISIFLIKKRMDSFCTLKPQMFTLFWLNFFLFQWF